MSSNGKMASHDPAAQQIGTVYAQALVGAAEAAGETQSVLEEFDSFIDDVLDTQPKFAEVLASVLIGADQKIDLLDKALAGQASKTFLNFLKIVAKHGRLDYLRSMRQAAHAIYSEARGHVSIEVRTATALDEASAERIRTTLSGILAREADLVRTIDPDLIGGLVVKVEDTVYDASVSTRLEKMRREMINRSVHEIQSRRDSFRSTTGD